MVEKPLPVLVFAFASLPSGIVLGKVPGIAF